MGLRAKKVPEPQLQGDAFGYVVLHEAGPKRIQDHPEFASQRTVMLRKSRALGLRFRAVPYDDVSDVVAGLTKCSGLIEVVAFAQSGDMNVLIIHDLNKLCFADLEAALLMLALQKWKVCVYESSTDENLTSQGDRWKQIVSGSGDEARRKAVRVLGEVKKLATRFRHSSHVGAQPYGSTPSEKDVLKRIWQLRHERRDGTGRVSYHAIAELLNLEGIKPRRGTKWYARTIQGIVRATKPHLDK